VPGSLYKKGGRKCHHLLSKRLHLLSPFLSNEPCTVLLLPEEGEALSAPVMCCLDVYCVGGPLRVF
jgi:hypothetical protein